MWKKYIALAHNKTHCNIYQKELSAKTSLIKTTSLLKRIHQVSHRIGQKNSYVFSYTNWGELNSNWRSKKKQMIFSYSIFPKKSERTK